MMLQIDAWRRTGDEWSDESDVRTYVCFSSALSMEPQLTGLLDDQSHTADYSRTDLSYPIQMRGRRDTIWWPSTM